MVWSAMAMFVFVGSTTDPPHLYPNVMAMLELALDKPLMNWNPARKLRK